MLGLVVKKSTQHSFFRFNNAVVWSRYALEYAAMTRELCTAYRLLEDHGGAAQLSNPVKIRSLNKRLVPVPTLDVPTSIIKRGKTWIRNFDFFLRIRLVPLRRGELKPGDAVIVNGATGTVGSVVVQLCAILKLRAVAVARTHPTEKGRDSVGWYKLKSVDP